jgi:hypothetical protein
MLIAKACSSSFGVEIIAAKFFSYSSKNEVIIIALTHRKAQG